MDIETNKATNIFAPMGVGILYIKPSEWGDEKDPRSDWSLATQYAAFLHKEACEFIFYLKFDDLSEHYRELGFSESFIDLLVQARCEGYTYACLYS